MKFEIATRCIASSAGQDRVFARILDDIAIVAVTDGAGGRAGGGEAAQRVIDEAAEIAPNVRNPRDPKFWARWLHEVDVLIRDDAQAGETTAIIAAVGEDFVAGASVGDSSAWLIGAEDWFDLTGNQTRKPFLGFGGASPMPFLARWSGQTLLLATDGLTKYADWQHLAQIARGAEIETAADELIAAVRLPSRAFPDDVSCILCRAGCEIQPRKRFGLF
ncbi:MAG: protein phosphatase 2C domain-containing protein [Armatimonadetes bacterium]|nr:protein phosphatase 2C domain-containing protein [Armatimonadota bacterium]